MMKNTRFFLLTLLCAVIFLFSGCSAKSTYERAPASMKASAKVVSPSSYGLTSMNSGLVNADYAVAEGMAAGGTDADSMTAEAVERKLIKNGSLTLEVENLDEAEQAVLSWCAALGGYLSDSSSWKSSRSITLRIPAEHFDDAMSGIGTLGTLVNRNINTNDVTDRYYDLQGRIQTKQILYERLNEYLKNATNMSDLISIESELNDVQSDLESMQGQMQRLSNQISFSTLTVYLDLPANQEEDGFQKITLGSRVSKLLGGFTTFLQYIVIGALALIVFGIPLILIAALLWCLCFGKIGLVRKLFSRLKK